MNHFWLRLQDRWVAPAYSGGVLLGIALSFFGAATNTMVGWLYALSGTILALLVIAGITAARSLAGLQVQRRPLLPVSAGDALAIELILENPTNRPAALLQVWDELPAALGGPLSQALEVLPPQSRHSVNFYPQTQRRGIYRWPTVYLRTAAPLGLFWCRRPRTVPARAVVYPQVLPLRRCPLIDTVSDAERFRDERDRRYQAANEGVTRTLRAYRHGDPTRLIHWRTSARFGVLQVRELETVTSGREAVVALDSAAPWLEELFESAVIAAASLYFYASRRQLDVQLWTAATGLLHGNQVVLEALAGTQAGEIAEAEPPRDRPLLWLTANAASLAGLSAGSRWLLFSETSPHLAIAGLAPGVVIERDRPLQPQLQTSLR
ncbi:MAG: DUF58 domain-containing protein [Spirulinaceae cyanobacterium SM2_1_0]|nr:DUF58 domain-containing protein [Spirulinaceae cyanobacterium SM2_1_0]